MTALAPASDAARVAIALALGREVDSPSRADWRRAHTVAHAERLAALSWFRSGDQIRRHAPPDVAALWRAECVAAGELAGRQLTALREIVRVTGHHGQIPLVLKGLPLAHYLYGDPSVRVCCDIDLLVPDTRRSAMHMVLTALGWQHWYGAPPFDASYRRTADGCTLFLEVHSLLVGEALAHCPLDAEGDRLWSYEGVTVRSLAGPVTAVYLSANLVKHGTPPLMSYVDLATVWKGLDPTDREAARRLAARSRLGRCLGWALARAAALQGAAIGDPVAFRMLGFHGDRRLSTHALMRLILLSDGLGDAGRVLAAWTWPRSLRRSRDAIVPFWSRRMRRSFAGRFRYTRSYMADGTARH